MCIMYYIIHTYITIFGNGHTSPRPNTITITPVTLSLAIHIVHKLAPFHRYANAVKEFPILYRLYYRYVARCLLS